jgi:hypothetical protein
VEETLNEACDPLLQGVREDELILEDYEQAVSPAHALGEHVYREWQAEEENARRLSQRTGSLVTLVAALLGVGLFKIEGASKFASGAHWSVVLTLCLGLVFLTIGIWIVLQAGAKGRNQRQKRGRNHHRVASSALAWRRSLLPEGKNYEFLAAEDIREMAALRWQRAAAHLRRMNIQKQSAVDKGQVLLLLAVTSGLVALVLVLLVDH